METGMNAVQCTFLTAWWHRD